MSLWAVRRDWMINARHIAKTALIAAVLSG